MANCHVFVQVAIFTKDVRLFKYFLGEEILTFDKFFMQRALKRIDELKQEMIEKSKKVPNSEAFVQKRMKDFYQTYDPIKRVSEFPHHKQL